MPAALTYRPSPLGLREAREAIAADYARRGCGIDADRIVLTASTSEAYSMLFKLLCEPGRSGVLTPVPSYPLFDHLTRLDGVGQRRYALEYHGAVDGRSRRRSTGVDARHARGPRRQSQQPDRLGRLATPTRMS